MSIWGPNGGGDGFGLPMYPLTHISVMGVTASSEDLQ